MDRRDVSERRVAYTELLKGEVHNLQSVLFLAVR
jgi:hypothetical protein